MEALTLTGQEIAATFLALLMLSAAGDWHFLARLPPAGFAQWLREVASGVNPKKYKRHGSGPKKPQQKTPHDPKHPHVSTHRLPQGQDNKTGEHHAATP